MRRVWGSLILIVLLLVACSNKKEADTVIPTRFVPPTSMVEQASLAVSPTLTSPPAWTPTEAFPPTWTPVSTGPAASAATPTMNVSESPDMPLVSPAREITFVIQRDVNVADIYAVAPDGTGLRAVIADGLENTAPRWSPDGTRLVYRCEYVTGTFGGVETGDTDVVVANADGSGAHPVADLILDQGADWSPDGTQVVFSAYSNPPSGGASIYIASADSTGTPRLLAAGVFFYGPDWSPNGRQIVAFGSRDDFYSDTGDLYMISTGSGGSRPLVDTRWSDSSPVWSPDGQMIAFITTDPSLTARGNIYVVNADGNDLRKVTIDDVLPGLLREFSWSPDSTRIAYTSAWGETDSQITPYVHIADLSGNILEYFPGFNPVWSPDGAYLAFVSSDPGPLILDITQNVLPTPHNLGIYVRDMSTGEIRRVADTGVPDMDYLNRLRPAWRP